jgi:hypothetical protein
MRQHIHLYERSLRKKRELLRAWEIGTEAYGLAVRQWVMNIGQISPYKDKRLKRVLARARNNSAGEENV